MADNSNPRDSGNSNNNTYRPPVQDARMLRSDDNSRPESASGNRHNTTTSGLNAGAFEFKPFKSKPPTGPRNDNRGRAGDSGSGTSSRSDSRASATINPLVSSQAPLSYGSDSWCIWCKKRDLPYNGHHVGNCPNRKLKHERMEAAGEPYQSSSTTSNPSLYPDTARSASGHNPRQNSAKTQNLMKRQYQSIQHRYGAKSTTSPAESPNIPQSPAGGNYNEPQANSRTQNQTFGASSGGPFLGQQEGQASVQLDYPQFQFGSSAPSQNESAARGSRPFRGRSNSRSRGIRDSRGSRIQSTRQRGPPTNFTGDAQTAGWANFATNAPKIDQQRQEEREAEEERHRADRLAHGLPADSPTVIHETQTGTGGSVQRVTRTWHNDQDSGAEGTDFEESDQIDEIHGKESAREQDDGGNLGVIGDDADSQENLESYIGQDLESAEEELIDHGYDQEGFAEQQSGIDEDAIGQQYAHEQLVDDMQEDIHHDETSSGNGQDDAEAGGDSYPEDEPPPPKSGASDISDENLTLAGKAKRRITQVLQTPPGKTRIQQQQSGSPHSPSSQDATGLDLSGLMDISSLPDKGKAILAQLARLSSSPQAEHNNGRSNNDSDNENDSPIAGRRPLPSYSPRGPRPETLSTKLELARAWQDSNASSENMFDHVKGMFSEKVLGLLKIGNPDLDIEPSDLKPFRLNEVFPDKKPRRSRLWDLLELFRAMLAVVGIYFFVTQFVHPYESVSILTKSRTALSRAQTMEINLESTISGRRVTNFSDDVNLSYYDDQCQWFLQNHLSDTAALTKQERKIVSSLDQSVIPRLDHTLDPSIEKPTLKSVIELHSQITEIHLGLSTLDDRISEHIQSAMTGAKHCSKSVPKALRSQLPVPIPKSIPAPTLLEELIQPWLLDLKFKVRRIMKSHGWTLSKKYPLDPQNLNITSTNTTVPPATTANTSGKKSREPLLESWLAIERKLLKSQRSHKALRRLLESLKFDLEGMMKDWYSEDVLKRVRLRDRYVTPLRMARSALMDYAGL